MTRNVRILGAETIGTFVLMLGGPGTAVLATGGFFPSGSVQVLGVALGFYFLWRRPAAKVQPQGG